MSQGSSNDSREWGPAIARITFLCLTLVLLGTVVYTLRSVIHAIILGVLFATLLMPLYRFNLRFIERLMHRIRLSRRHRKQLSFGEQTRRARRIDSRNRSLASAVTVALVFVVVVVPLSMLTVSFGKQGFQATVSAQHWLVNEFPGKIQGVIERYSLREKLGQVEGLYQRVSGVSAQESGVVDLSASSEQDEEVIVSLSSLSEQIEASEVSDGPIPEIRSVSEEALRDDSAKIISSPEARPVVRDGSGKGSFSESNAISEGEAVPLASVSFGESSEELEEDSESVASADDGSAGPVGLQGSRNGAFKSTSAAFDSQIGVWVSYVVNRVLEIVQETLVLILSRIWVLIFNFCIMLFVMYQLFYDGDNIGTYIRSISPLGDNELRRVTIRLKQVTRAIFYGIFGTALTQGAVSMIVFKCVDIPVFWGVLLGFSSIVPVVGTSLIWVPVTLYLVLVDSYGKALVVFLCCGCLVANLDMLLRPLLMKKSGDTGLSYMVLFLSILGGIQSFGVVGVIYGPLIAALCSICLLLFSTQFKGVKERMLHRGSSNSGDEQEASFPSSESPSSSSQSSDSSADSKRE